MGDERYYNDEDDDDDSDSEEDYTTKYSKSIKSKTIKDMDTYTKGNKSFKSTLAKTKATKKSMSANKSLLIRNETNNNIHDLLHSNMASNLQYINEEDNENDDSDFDFSDDDDDMVMEFDNDGKMIIPDDDSVQKEENDDDESKD